MQPRFRFHGGISGGGELARRDIDALAKQGFRSIFDLREEGEPGQTLSPNVAATWAHACGLEHRRLAVSVEHLEPRLVDLFLQTLAELPRPVYVHSQSGRRAATF